jgi:hypothetical protein
MRNFFSSTCPLDKRQSKPVSPANEMKLLVYGDYGDDKPAAVQL